MYTLTSDESEYGWKLEVQRPNMLTREYTIHTATRQEPYRKTLTAIKWQDTKSGDLEHYVNWSLKSQPNTGAVGSAMPSLVLRM